MSCPAARIALTGIMPTRSLNCSSSATNVAVAAIAFWLIVFRRRAGYVIAIAYGVFTVVLYTISLTTPTDPGPSLAPAALYALGMVAAVVMTLGGALALRR